MTLPTYDAPSTDLRPSDDEASGRLHVEDGVVVEILGGDDLGNNLLHQVLAQLLQGHVIRVLDRHDDGVHALGDAHALLHAILARHLRNASTH